MHNVLDNSVTLNHMDYISGLEIAESDVGKKLNDRRDRKMKMIVTKVEKEMLETLRHAAPEALDATIRFAKELRRRGTKKNPRQKRGFRAS